MSQDSQRCPKCGRPSGHDSQKAYWGEGNFYLCGQCKGNLISRFTAFFGLNGLSSDESSLMVEWKDVDKILSRIQRDYSWRISYIVTDKELYERTKTMPVSILARKSG